MAERGGREALINDLLGEELWKVFDQLAPISETDLSLILRPHDEAGSNSEQNDPDIKKRRKDLDAALDALTLLEIGFQIGIFDADEFPTLQPHSPKVKDLRLLVEGSGAFLRYANAYLYFGVRMLAYRWFGPGWIPSIPPSELKDKSANRRYFPQAFPPNPVVLSRADAATDKALNENLFDQYVQAQRSPECADALNFLDGFQSNAGQERYPETEKDHEPVQFELWLRGLLPEADPAQQEHFRSISTGIYLWVETHVEFYSSLTSSDADATDRSGITQQMRLTGDEIVTNPLAARFALADIYWIARLLRADVSATASVRYSRDTWLHLVRFRATLDRQDNLVTNLRRAEEILRSVFDFVCDLVQNSAGLTEQRERRQFQPEDYPPQQKCTNETKLTRQWRAVFDEELREIDRQRSERTYVRPKFGDDEPFPLSACDEDQYWTERLITGRQPHNRIGVAFSGGGIRSATFNLGILQGLQEFDLLRHVDYLSTVSGGGFIGSWLIGNVKRTKQWLGRATCWDESVAHLRAYSSYLAPLTGILSADTWTLGASWLRNTFLIQITGLVWLLAILLAGLGGRMIFLWTAAKYTIGPLTVDSGFLFAGWRHFPYIGFWALLMALFVTGSLVSNFLGDLRFRGKHSYKPQVVRWLCVLPSWLGAFIVAAMLWSTALAWPQVQSANASAANIDTHAFSFLLQHAWRWLVGVVFFHLLALLVIGWFALKPSDTLDADQSNSAADSGWRSVTVWRMVWIGTLCTVVLYLGLCAILFLDLYWMVDAIRFQSFAYVFGPALVLTAFAMSVVMFIGLSGRKSNEAQREWWTRYGAWLTIYAVAGLAIAGAAVMGPKITTKLFTSGHHVLQWSSILSWLGSVIGGLFAGKSSKTAGDASAGKKMGVELLAKLGGLMFIVGAAFGTATLLYYLVLNIATNSKPSDSYWSVLNHIQPMRFLGIVAVVLLCGALFSWFFEINIFGLSQFYRNRLVRCYLGATRWAPGLRKPHPFTQFDFKDDLNLSDLKEDFRGPFPIFNCTLNLAGSSDLSLHSRHSASFSLTPLRCGSDRPKVGYAPTSYHRPGGPTERFAGGVQVGQAVAISGAAASPNMGYNTSPLVALLLTMFNVRLGWWFPNPGQHSWNASGLRFSLYYLSRELLGLADETRLFLNVSDGGHFENLGVYELVRRRCKVIFACDAECDEVLQFGGLANLVRVCETDFGAVIDLDTRSIAQQKEGHSLSHCAVGKIKYSNGSIGYLIYLKASVTGDEDIGIRQYRSIHPSFPHETTANQFFSEDQFESYRKLGQHVIRHSLRGIQPGEHPMDVANKLADVMAPARTTGEAFLRHTQTLAGLWDEFRQSPALHSFVDELMHIVPPVAVVPPAPAGAHQASEELCMALQLMQLMEDVFMDLQLDDFWDHPDNRGWAILFMRFARSPRFRTFWQQTRRTFGIRFEYFCEARLGLKRDNPIVRV